MAKRPAKGPQLNTLPKASNQLEQVSFNLDKQDSFIKSHGVTFEHYRAIPSPVGLKDRGEYRRSDSIDTISSNGFIYKKCGTFTAVLLGNNKREQDVEGGMFDYSTARLTLPRYYDEDDTHQGETIHLAPGDRVYIKDMEVAVVNYQRVDYNPAGMDFLQYPALCVEFLIDSRGIEYKQGHDFKIASNGCIDWIDGKKNPGIDPDTKAGRVYSVRYRYSAHWYIASIINEIRVGNVTENGVRKPSRMPYHAMIQREYIYHQKNNDGSNENKKEDGQPSRVSPKPDEDVEPNKYQVKVNVNTLE
jgi:hypothetical protein